MLYPATEEVLGFQVRVTLCGVGLLVAVPVPERVSTSFDCRALLKNFAFADAAPLLCGLNVTVNVTLLPAARVNGKAAPLTVNSPLFVPAEEIITLATLAVRVLVIFFELPTFTFPKPMFARDMLSLPIGVALPDKEIAKVEPLAASVSLPVLFPLPFGTNFTVKVKLSPALNVTGTLKPLRLKAVPFMVTFVIFNLEAPVFLMVP
jgi:hypothetical protein